MRVRIHRLLVFSIEPCRIPEQEPKLGVTRGGLRCTPGELKSLRASTLLKRQLRRACESSVLNVGAPTQRLVFRRRLSTLRARALLSFWAHLVGLCVRRAREDDEHERSLQESKFRSNTQGVHQGAQNYVE